MNLSIEQVAAIDTLQSLLDRYDLSSEDYCLVGSASLAVRGLRTNDDLDICFVPEIEPSIDASEFEAIQPAPSKYEHIGISDEQLVTTPAFHDVVDGHKIIRPELEYSHKKVRGWDKDTEDIELLEQYREETDDWDPDLERHDYTPGPTHLFRRGFASLKRDGVRQTIGHGIQYLRWHGPLSRKNSQYSGQPTTIPGKAVMSLKEDGIRTTLGRGVRLVKRKEPTGLLDRYSHLRHKAKLGTLAERQLKLRYPTAALLTEQYQSEEYTRFDVIVRLLAAAAILEDEALPAPVQTLERESDLQVQSELEPIVDQYDASGAPPAVPVSYDSSILDANRFAVALLHDRTSVPVVVQTGSKQPTYDRDWMDAHLPEDERETVNAAFSELLYDSNALFPSILWPPAQEHFDDIEAQLREEKTIHFTAELTFSEAEFPEFVWALYESQQDLNPDHIDTKIEEMSDYEKRIRILAIEVPNPRIREGFSNEVLQMKERVREQFTPKILTDTPSANLIIHSTDNYDHNRETWDVIEDYESRDTLTINKA